jgi:hypothetical protein
MSIDAMKQAVDGIAAVCEALAVDAPQEVVAQLWDIHTALRAAIEAAEKQEPVARFNWNEGKFEWLTPYKYELHHMKPLYLSSQPAIPAGMVLVPVEQLDTLIQSITEMSHARRNPNWFTKGKQGADNQWFLWEQRGLAVVKAIAAAPNPENSHD